MNIRIKDYSRAPVNGLVVGLDLYELLKKCFPILHSVYHFEERKEQRIGHKTLGLSKTYSVFLVKEKNQRYCQIALSSSFTFLFRKKSLLSSPRVCVIIAEVLVMDPHRLHQEKLKKKEKKNSHLL